jgi:hypothetical protein
MSTKLKRLHHLIQKFLTILVRIFKRNRHQHKQFIIFSNYNTQIQFGVLIIPDIVMGSESIILNLLGSSGINNIRRFVQNGGKINFN